MNAEKEVMIDNLQKMRAPAIALIISASLNGLAGLIELIAGLFRLAGIGGGQMMPVNDAERIGYLTGTVIVYGSSLLTLLVAPVIIYGAIQMIKGKRYRLARIAAILAIIPFTSCCFLVSIPIGIWGLIVLSKSEVKAAFNIDHSAANLYPPQPPQNW
jgi:hypothetical protein